ncbi:PQQ-binding-like beta-propeller repeat protein [Streptomyces albipurpureus]|uniref:PQQ-binding-like beta-propeller repeat protein n=1 Tax=Streptomyces albipurpureus TaxID=2897419 RepID=A0ABT0UL86_9ACTN|nr:PQQ-binding-like beta-propeller repeat protein [Streptomyces sp. CWNU-1]MCM2389374.1 PQQ-binding-like beta-propeller repeat protein [Streptomyces sp. CWNU-1]
MVSVRGQRSLTTPRKPVAEDDDHQLYGLDIAPGEPRWQFKAGGPVRCAPVVVDGVVYVGSDDHHLYAVETRSGPSLL